MLELTSEQLWGIMYKIDKQRRRHIFLRITRIYLIIKELSSIKFNHISPYIPSNKFVTQITFYGIANFWYPSFIESLEGALRILFRNLNIFNKFLLKKLTLHFLWYQLTFIIRTQSQIKTANTSTGSTRNQARFHTTSISRQSAPIIQYLFVCFSILILIKYVQLYLVGCLLFPAFLLFEFSVPYREL